MKALPSIAEISPPGVDVAEMQAALFNWLGATRQLLGGGPPQSKTIVSGALAPDEDVCFWIQVDTEGAAPTDDLDRLTPTNIPDGSLVLVQAVNTARTIVVRHAQGGSGQFFLSNASNYSLDDSEKFILFRYNLSSTGFVEFIRGWGADVSALRTYLGLGTAALVNTGTGDADVPTNLQIFKTPRDYTRQQRFVPVTLSYSASYALDFDLHQKAKITLAGPLTLSNPSNVRDGADCELKIYNASGSSVSFGSAFKGVNNVLPVVSTGVNHLTILTFSVDASNVYVTATGPFPL